MSDDYKRLSDAFKGYNLVSGIFSILQNFDAPYDVPWKSISGIGHFLDLEYFGNVSGDKIVSPYINKMTYDSSTGLSDNARRTIGYIIINLFRTNWVKQWATMSLEYDPIQNYNMVEEYTGTDDITYGKRVNDSGNTSLRKTGTDTEETDNTTERTDDLTETTTPQLTGHKEENVYAFNSATASPIRESDETSGGSNAVDRTGTQTTEIDQSVTTTYNTTETGTTGNQTTESGTDSRETGHELTRSGNIGVTTTQQMIESERNLWMWHYFYDIVFPDVDRVLTIQIY